MKRIKIKINDSLKGIDEIIDVMGLSEDDRAFLRERNLDEYKFLSYDVKNQKAKLVEDLRSGKKVVNLRRVQTALVKQRDRINDPKLTTLVNYLIGLSDLRCFYIEVAKSFEVFTKFEGGCSRQLGLGIRDLVEHHVARIKPDHVKPYIGEYIYKSLPRTNNIYVYSGDETMLAAEIINKLKIKKEENVKLGLFDLDMLTKLKEK